MSRQDDPERLAELLVNEHLRERSYRQGFASGAEAASVIAGLVREQDLRAWLKRLGDWARAEPLDSIPFPTRPRPDPEPE